MTKTKDKPFNHHQKNLCPVTWAQSIINDDHNALSQAITLIESTLDKDRLLAQKLIQQLHLLEQNQHHRNPHQCLKIGISGIAGSGKSTLIEKIGKLWIEKGHRVSVSSIDPSSIVSGGSLLADKTRMTELSSNKNAFIRPSPSKGISGGVARRTRETIYLLEKAKYSRIIIETMGSGQSEVECDSIVDLMVVLVCSNTGDMIQAMKKGLYEHGDFLVVSKADNPNDKYI